MCDVSLYCGSCINHVTLVNKVYPTEPGQEGPQSSNLSYLVFYASSKPHKLPKIGAYLEKRVKVDMRRNKNVYIKITLDIINALLNACHQHLNLISKSVLRIVQDVAESPDPDIVMLATTTFVVFSGYHNHESAADKEFTDLYDHLVARFCLFSVYETSNHLMRHKMRLSGLKALHGMASNETFLLDQHCSIYVQQMVPSAVENFKELTSLPHPSTKDSSPRAVGSPRHSIADELITPAELGHIAESCLQELCKKTNATTLKMVLAPLLNFFDVNGHWSHQKKLVLHVIKSVCAAVQPQYRYVLVSSILERLNDADFSSVKSRKTTLIKTLTHLIASSGATVSLTILELLDTLVKNLLVSVKSTASVAVSTAAAMVVVETASAVSAGGAGAPLDKASIEEDLIVQDALVDSIGSLATHVHYPEQVNDILSYLVNRMFVSDPLTSISESAGPPDGTLKLAGVDKLTVETRKALLRCLAQVVHVRLQQCHHDDSHATNDGSNSSASETTDKTTTTRSTHASNASKRSSIVKSPIPYELVVPLLKFFLDENPDVRVQFQAFLYKLLSLEIAEAGMGLPLVDSGKFCAKMNRYLYEYALSPINNPSDYAAIGTIFNLSLRRFFRREFVSTLPLMWKFESLVKEGKVPSASRQRALGNVVVEYLATAGEAFDITELKEYAAKLKQDRIDAQQWSPNLELSFDGIAKIHGKSFTETEGVQFSFLRPLTLFVSQSEVKAVLINRVAPVWKDVEDMAAILDTDYVPAADDPEDDPSKRRRRSVQRTPNAHVGLLSAPVSGKQKQPSIRTTSSSDTPMTVKVEELKDALASDKALSTKGDSIDLDGASVGLSVAASSTGAVSNAGSGAHGSSIKADVKNLLHSISQTFDSHIRKPQSSLPPLSEGNSSNNLTGNNHGSGSTSNSRTPSMMFMLPPKIGSNRLPHSLTTPSLSFHRSKQHNRLSHQAPPHSHPVEMTTTTMMATTTTTTITKQPPAPIMPMGIPTSSPAGVEAVLTVDAVALTTTTTTLSPPEPSAPIAIPGAAVTKTPEMKHSTSQSSVGSFRLKEPSIRSFT
ncbi:hypothetical protein HK102_014058 [Quaeritorhiza haematococci]|nr:hypothetical protein HK102_014058 [Quaeritorhiza haematococci]